MLEQTNRKNPVEYEKNLIYIQELSEEELIYLEGGMMEYNLSRLPNRMFEFRRQKAENQLSSRKGKK